MNTEQDLMRIAEQLLRYVAMVKPKDGVFEHTDTTANNILLSLLDGPTYVFDYSNLQDKSSRWNGIDHLTRLATTPPEKGNYLTKVLFPGSSVIRNLLYLSIPDIDEGKGRMYSHFTLPEIKKEFLENPAVQVTPRCLGLHTFISVDPKDHEVNVDLHTTNKALQKEYKGLGGAIDYTDLYHHTLFSMTYALEYLLCTKKQYRIVLPEDDKQHAPSIRYTEVEILDQPTDAQQ